MSNQNSNLKAAAQSFPDLKKKLKIWAIRSVIVVVLAYVIVAFNGPTWLIWAAWIYVGVTLVTGIAMSLYAQKLLSGNGGNGGGSGTSGE